MPSISTIDSFDTVLDAARGGSEWAWDRIYRSLAPSVTGYLRANGAAEADDLTGEVFLHVVGGLERFCGGEHDFRAWVFTIAHRRLVDDLRRRSRRPRLVAADDVAARAVVGGDVQEESLRALDEAAVRAALEQLAPDQRTVLLLRILGDLTIEEIARAVGKRPGAVKALQRRALRRLEQAYPYERSGR